MSQPLTSQLLTNPLRYLPLTLMAIGGAIGCVPEPKLDYPEPPLTFSQAVDDVTPRADALPPLAPMIEPDMEREPIDQGPPDMVLDIGIMDEGVVDAMIPDMTPIAPRLRTRSLQWIGAPDQRTSRGTVELYGNITWGGGSPAERAQP